MHNGNLTQGGVYKAAEEATMACSPELGVDCLGEMLLGKMPQDRKNYGKKTLI
jgi:hypothetical protein